MTEKGTFVINGAERVVVSQLARSPGVYFKDTLDFSGRVLYFATIIPSPGAWIDIETDANDVITVRVAQTKKFPLTTLLRALNMFQPACPTVEVLPASEAMGRTLAATVVNKETGEVLFEAGSCRRREDGQEAARACTWTTSKWRWTATPCGTTAEILELFSTQEDASTNPTPDAAQGLQAYAGDQGSQDDKVDRQGWREDQRRSGQEDREAEARRRSKSMYTNRYIDATLEQDSDARHGRGADRYLP